MIWRVCLIDSCGSWPGAIDTAAFVSDGQRLEHRATVTDPSGHGSRIAQLFTTSGTPIELLLGQVFLTAGATSGAAVAAAVDWAIARRASLIHMSLGLEADRAVLKGAVAHAIGSGCIIVASMPARGTPVYPAAYPGVIRATGDARCEPGELSCLGPWFFGGCARFAGCGKAGSGVGVGAAAAAAAGASVGAAWVTRHILNGPAYAVASTLVATMTAGARYVGRERRRS